MTTKHHTWVNEFGIKLSFDIDAPFAHAPKGGIIIAGTWYSGGEFIPDESLASATPEEKEFLEKRTIAAGSGKKKSTPVISSVPVQKQDTDSSVQSQSPISPLPPPTDVKPSTSEKPPTGGKPSNKKHIDAASDSVLKSLEARSNKGISDGLKKALLQYSTASYKPLNTALRSGEKIPPDLEELTRKLDEAFESTVTEKGAGKLIKSKVADLPGSITVRRGISFGSKEDRESFLKKLAGSNIVVFKEYLSTTVHQGIANKFSSDNPNPVQFVINTAKGIVMGEAANVQGEGEVLLPRNSSFAVTAIKGNTVYMENLE